MGSKGIAELEPKLEGRQMRNGTRGERERMTLTEVIVEQTRVLREDVNGLAERGPCLAVERVAVSGSFGVWAGFVDRGVFACEGRVKNKVSIQYEKALVRD